MTTSTSTALPAILLFVAASATAQAASAAQQPQTPSDPDDPKVAGYFSGRVTGPDGTPVAGARVFVVPVDVAKREASPMRAETEADGGFEFEAPDMVVTDLDGLATRRRCLVVATAAGYGPDWIEARGRARLAARLRPRAGTDLELQLATDDVPIRGRLLDPDGRPLAGARVQLQSLFVPRRRDLDAYIAIEIESAGGANGSYDRKLFQPHLLPGLTVETRTDADGRFTLTGLGRDRIAALKVSAPQIVDSYLTVVTREMPDVEIRLDENGPLARVIYGAGFTAQLERGFAVEGLVIDRESREPIPGMWVVTSGNPLSDMSFGERARTTDAAGRFMITGLDPQLLGKEKKHRKLSAFSAPGMLFQMASGYFEGDAEVLIECPRGIPFRLRLVDEQGQLVDADVTYTTVEPNPHINGRHYQNHFPVSRAARKAKGTYAGFVLPGPGAVLVKTDMGSKYRTARVDPKAFFAPDHGNWTPQERITAYGTQNTLSIPGAWLNQHDYAAILLVNPAPDAGKLELSTTLATDRPRQVFLVDSNDKPVVGVMTEGLTFHPWDYEPPLRAASFPLMGLNSVRVRRITFFHEERQLIAFLPARADAETPYVVRMQPWATVTGRIVDVDGQPLPVRLSLGDYTAGTEIDNKPSAKTDDGGRFRIDRLVPGRSYTARVYSRSGELSGTAFENQILHPAEIRDLGDVRIKRILVAHVGSQRKQ